MVEFTLTVDDLVAFAAWQAKASGEEDPRRARMRLVGAWLVGGAAYLAMFAVATLPFLLSRLLELAGAAELVSVLVGAAVGWWEWQRGRAGEWLVARRYRTKARVALEQTGTTRRLELDDDGLTILAGRRSTHVPWSRISRVVETDDHVFVYTGPDAAHVIPRRAGGAVTDLVATLRSRLA